MGRVKFGLAHIRYQLGGVSIYSSIWLIIVSSAYLQITSRLRTQFASNPTAMQDPNMKIEGKRPICTLEESLVISAFRHPTHYVGEGNSAG